MDSLEAVQRVDTLLGLYRKAENSDYFGEAVTQAQHASQTAALAKAAGADNVVVIAALLHDVGHLLDWDNLRRHKEVGVIDHDRAGAEYLKNLGFSRRVCQLVEGHVSAKRYLVATNPHYAAQLSPTSRMSLELQGGPMNADEAALFAATITFEDCLRLREWDEQAKAAGGSAPGMESYRDLLIAHLSRDSM
jgi:phosphonate degradation associated HDIG domain protein